ncbi:hypothetical protein HanOQP8_Chr02g0052781 [Helianthus annuus]|nr:hypothetical protein HanOQP8_Chr02g0052781 [Helianthus annuus]
MMIHRLGRRYYRGRRCHLHQGWRQMLLCRPRSLHVIRCHVLGVRQENAAGQRRVEDGMKVIVDHLQVQPSPSWQPQQEELADVEQGLDEG